MAIAFVAAADLGDNAGATSTLSVSYTCGSGTDRLLFVVILGDSVVGNDDITSVTYNSVAMTLGVKNTQGSNRFLYTYYLLNPDSGSNTVLITAGSTHYLLALAADYTGVQQSSQPDTTATGYTNSGTSLTTNFTTGTANSWAMFGEASFGTTPTAASGCTKRTQGAAFAEPSLFDSGADLSVGANSVATNGSTSVGLLHALVAFKPTSGGGGGLVGPLTHGGVLTHGALVRSGRLAA